MSGVKTLLLVLLASATLSVASARAQTVPPPFTTQGAVPTITQWSNAWAGKLDAPLTAGTTPTSGFTAGQLMMSDGTLTQPAGAASVANSLNIAPATLGSLLFTNGTYGQIGPNAGMLAIQPNASLGHTLGVFYSTNPQKFKVYNTFTDGNNGEWAALDWQTTPNVLTIGTQANGTGTARGIQFTANGANIMNLGITAASWVTTNSSLSVGINSDQNIYAGTARINLFQTAGLSPTITGSGGTCATSTKVGGATVGTVVLSGVCASTNTIAFTGMPSTSNGYVCDATDRTTRTAGPFIESAATTTGFTLTVGATSSVAGDVLQWKCLGY